MLAAEKQESHPLRLGKTPHRLELIIERKLRQPTGQIRMKS